MTGSATVIRGNARELPLPDDTVDLIVTSPPYFALRSYQDGGEHYAGQIGDEPTPAEFVDSLIEVTRECVRVLKPSGSLWVNLGDKYAGVGGANNGGTLTNAANHQREAKRLGPVYGSGARRAAPPKSLIGIPWRYALRCIDDLGLILRAEVIWSKPNGLPESVTDRVRRSHEQWFHFTLQPRYFSAVDEIREPHDSADRKGERSSYRAGQTSGNTLNGHDRKSDAGLPLNPLGKLPGSVWTVATEPLKVPDHLGVDHFAAFPTEWPKRIISGWSPAGVCVECGEGRRPVVASVSMDMSRPQARRAHELATQAGLTEDHFKALLSVGVSDTGRGKATQSGTGKNTAEVYRLADEAREALGGYSREYLLRRPSGFRYICACTPVIWQDIEERDENGERVSRRVERLDLDWVNPAPTTPAVVLDPFGGTGTTAMVAKALGRHGITVDMSADYCRLARWRTSDRNQLAKVLELPKVDAPDVGQLDLFGELG